MKKQQATKTYKVTLYFSGDTYKPESYEVQATSDFNAELEICKTKKQGRSTFRVTTVEVK